MFGLQATLIYKIEAQKNLYFCQVTENMKKMKQRYIVITLLFLLGFPLVFFGQEDQKSYKNGELLVQLDKASDLDRLLSDYKVFGIKTKKTISEHFHIYLLEFDDRTTSDTQLLRALKSEKSVLNIQNNHFISLRESEEVTPDDSLFQYQWALKNTGQNGGKWDADIDATDAWEHTTRGVTATGDSIVVAVIDGGSDLFHEDLRLWKNRAEIPTNGIDDDNNGYIDDYNGWNAYEHNGNIPFHNHGTLVTGIIAAKGNNDLGVTGINWNAKVLPVVGSSTTESVVVEALSYVYTVRKTYDDTDGDEGAFIVAVNCSFGVDKGQPEDFPIWEAMYDSLGTLGVLSIGATTNKTADVDSVGDIPTAFTTPYMISVTNTTKLDVKNISAGYGATTIDLGAPGTDIMSCRINNTYGTSSGTSFAAPQVSGAVALLMAGGDADFMENYKENPAETILLVRQYILDGVDKLESLEEYTATGGRLNVNNALNLLLKSPVIGVSQDSVVVDLPLNSGKDIEWIIVNVGGDTLFYQFSFEDQPEWLMLNKYEGALKTNRNDNIIFGFNSTGLPAGVYATEMLISAKETVPKTIPIKMYVIDDTGIEDLSQQTEVRVYPNPFSTNVHFEISGLTGQVYGIEIFDHWGKKVFTDQSDQALTNQRFDWETSRSGIFYYRILINMQPVKSGKIISY